MLLALLALLGGCSGVGRRTSYVQPRPVGISEIPNAVPRVEPLSKYGNPPSYVVDGRRYYTLKSARGYVARGIASWYGPKFHGRRTSSGEPYDMYAMTAASKTLPLPSFVEVTNLLNHRHVIVRVNDRGPFVDHRLIDLSYVAALKLGIYGRGTAPVVVRGIDPRVYLAKHPAHRHVLEASVRPGGRVRPPVLLASAARAASPPRTERARAPAVRRACTDCGPVARMYVQAGAFSEFGNAERLKVRLQRLFEVPVRIYRAMRDGTSLYRVQLGPLRDERQADRMRTRLVDRGVVRPQIVVE